MQQQSVNRRLNLANTSQFYQSAAWGNRLGGKQLFGNSVIRQVLRTRAKGAIIEALDGRIMCDKQRRLKIG